MMYKHADTLTIYQTALKRLNRCFKDYQEHPADLTYGKTLHFTSQQMRNFPDLINFFQHGPGHSFPFQTEPDQFEKMCENMRNLGDLKITCIGDYVVELQQFSSLRNLHIVGPCLREIKGLRSASCNLLSLIVENGNIYLNELLSRCCMDESRPMSWPQLLSLKVSNCSLRILDTSLKLLPNLQELDLSFNELSQIKDQLSCLDHISHLNLGFNYIKSIPEFTGGIKWSLQFLYLPYNDVSNLEGLQELENLTDLDISHNLLIQHVLLEPLRHLSKLEKLDLRGNPLSYRSRHRELAVRYISPLAINLEFCLDGKQLSNYDLAEAMYTPIAIQCSQYAGQFDTSINTMEPDLYDISMVSGSRAAGRNSYFKLRSGKSKRNSVHRRDSDDQFMKIQRDQLAGKLSLGKSFSPSSSIETLSCSYSSRLHRDAHHQSTSLLQDNVECYFAAAAAAYSIEKNMEQEPCSRTSFLKDGKRNNALCTLVAQSSNKGEDDIILELFMMEDCLLELDFENGDVLETIPFDVIHNVIVLSAREVNLKFYCTKKHRSVSRVYQFLNEKLERIDSFFSKLEDMLKTNENQKKHHLVCPKCSKTYVIADSTLVCNCGSDLIGVDSGIRSNQQRLSDCDTAIIPEVNSDRQLAEVESPDKRGISIPSRTTATGAVTGISLSWVHSAQDMPAVGHMESLLKTRDGHISSSLPAYLSEVLGPYAGTSKHTNSEESELLMRTAQQPDILFRSFPNLMPPHEIYKLVEVTPALSDNSCKKECVKDQYVKSPLDGRPFTPQPCETISNDGKDDNSEREHGCGHKQVIVTSTPRRKIKRSQIAIETGETPRMQASLLQHRRSLDFDNESGTSVYEELWSQRSASGKLPRNVSIRHFVEDELLDAGEDLFCIRKSIVFSETGRKLVELVSQSPPAKGIFVRKHTLDQKDLCPHPLKALNGLIIITTINLHVLETPNTGKPGPEHLRTYLLKDIVGVATGLRSLSTFIAVGKYCETKLDFKHVQQILAVPFSDSKKCRKFQKLLFESACAESKGSNVDQSPNVVQKKYQSSILDEESKPFSDFLERNFSENVLLHLDLSAPESSMASNSKLLNKLVNADMFTHFHCCLQNGVRDPETSVLLVVSCSGSLSVVYENSALIMYSYGSALLQTMKDRKTRMHFLEHEKSLVIPRSKATSSANPMYIIKTTKQCSQIVSVIRFANQSDYVQFHFSENEEEGWNLKFTGSDSAEAALKLLEEFHFMGTASTLPVIWR